MARPFLVRVFVDELPIKVLSMALAVTLFVLVRNDKDATSGSYVKVIYTLPEDRVLVAINNDTKPAEVRIHPAGGWAYVNNRGEDSLAWFAITDAGHISRRGHVRLAESLHPGVAARSFDFDPTGEFLVVADRPADLVRTYRADRSTGALEPMSELEVGAPAFITFAELQG